jgi:eukaryotic-like serine/threonine-protein kinase
VITAVEAFRASAHESGEQASVGASDAHASAREQSEELPAGTLVAGKYRVKAVLGRGGFAVVYDAEHLGLGRDVALKLLRRTDGTPQVLIERFMREVRISALVRHPNVLEVYDAGVHQDGSPFLAMEKISGLSLHQQLCMQGKLSVTETCAIARQLLSALVAIGARGIVHRDIKPENLMLGFAADGTPSLKLVDFGIALMQEPCFAQRLTQHGALVGTPHYMAPEQLRSECVDARVDLYAAGVVMYQALTGTMPYDGADLSALTLSVLNGKARSLRALCPACPSRLARVVERALYKEPERRFADARDMLAALDAVEAGRTSYQALATTRSLLQRAARNIRAHELLVACGTVALMALGTGRVEVAEALRATLGSAAAPPAATLQASALDEPRASLHGQPNVQAVREPAKVPSAPMLVPEAEPPRAEPKVAAKSSAPPAPPRVATSEAENEATQRARALTRRGLTLYLHAELDAAYAVYRKASLLAPAEAAAFRGLGLSASRLGRGYEARRAFTRYLELAPSAPDAALIRARLAELISEEAARGLRGGEG